MYYYTIEEAVRVINQRIQIYNDVSAQPISDEAQSGAASTITLAAVSSAVDDHYNNWYISIITGTGKGQNRLITDYDGATKVATVDTAWTTIPDATSGYKLQPLRQDDLIADVDEVEAKIHTFLASRYTIPVTGVDSINMIRNCIRAYLIYKALLREPNAKVPDSVIQASRDCDKMLMAIADGKLDLPDDSAATTDNVRVDLESNEPLMIRGEGLRRF